MTTVETISNDDWRNELKSYPKALKLEPDQSRTIEFKSDGRKWHDVRYNRDEILFDVTNEYGDHFTWYVPAKNHSLLKQIASFGTPLVGQKAKVTRSGEGLKTRYTVLK